jgi:hypothetical protein
VTWRESIPFSKPFIQILQKSGHSSPIAFLADLLALLHYLPIDLGVGFERHGSPDLASALRS